MTWRQLPRPSVPARQQRILCRGLQGLLAVLCGYGFYVGAPKVITNAGGGLLITMLPAVLRRNYRYTLAPPLTLWITAAVALHALGSAWLYTTVGWWDSVTHALSATVVASIGYVAILVIDYHDKAIHLPRRFLFVYIIVFVTAFGVLWELFEFGLDVLAARTTLTMPLSQVGIDDTISDLIFNIVGAVLVGIGGQVYLTDLSEELAEMLYG